jgi:hypothetical protein
VAVADFGNYPRDADGTGDGAEIVVVYRDAAMNRDAVRVQTIAGRVVFGPVAVPTMGPPPGGMEGGAPTVADFDGDGRPEFATAAGYFFTVFDPDCRAGGPPGGCASGRTDGVLWSRPSHDHSSAVTGSSVFDFNADGRAEVVYADECYLRVYDGRSGTVLFSAPRASGTAYENPVIADVDGDHRSEIVASLTDWACPQATDPLRPTTRFVNGHGVVVYRDAMDLWADSRPVWNQHAYAVTNVGDRGEVPPPGPATPNWRTPGLNSFRANAQGPADLEIGRASCRERVS